MENNNNDFVNWTNELIEAEIASGGISNVLRICEENFDMWTKVLFPILQERKKPCYKAVVALLHRGGCTNATESMVQSYFTYIRKKRGIKPTKPVSQLVAPTVAIEASVMPEPEVITKSVAVKPVVPVKAHQTVSAVVQVDSNSHVYAETCSVEPEDYEDIREEISRLENEKKNGWSADWCGRDEFFWKEILEAGKKVSLYGGQKWTFDGNPLAIKKELSSEARKTIYDLLIKKVATKRT
jgi:hypothetical protein